MGEANKLAVPERYVSLFAITYDDHITKHRDEYFGLVGNRRTGFFRTESECVKDAVNRFEKTPDFIGQLSPEFYERVVNGISA